MDESPNDEGTRMRRLSLEAEFQDKRMELALQGEDEFRDKFYFINRKANACYERLHEGLEGKRVVVVGSSDAGVTPLARRGVYVEGIDISAISVEKLSRAIAKEGLSRYASARVMDAEKLDYAPRSVDAITCSGVLHHLNTEAALRSWAHCLRPDGRVLMFEPLAFHPLAAVFRAFTPSMRTPDEHPLRGRDFELMHRYFGRVERFDFGLFTPLSAGLAVVPGMIPVARALLPALEGLDAVLLKLIPPIRALCWLTVVRLTAPV